MKKKLITFVAVVLLAAFAMPVFAAALSAVSGNRRDRVISELQTQWNLLQGGTGDLTVNTLTVSSTAAITGVMTLTAAPKVTAVTASGTATALTTNAPACTEETPIWITVTYGTNDYVTPAWLLD